METFICVQPDKELASFRIQKTESCSYSFNVHSKISPENFGISPTALSFESLQSKLKIYTKKDCVSQRKHFLSFVFHPLVLEKVWPFAVLEMKYRFIQCNSIPSKLHFEF